MAIPYATEVQDTSGAQFDASLALRAKILSLYSLDTNSDAVRIHASRTTKNTEHRTQKALGS